MKRSVSYLMTVEGKTREAAVGQSLGMWAGKGANMKLKEGEVGLGVSFTESTFDREANTISNVVLLGPVSKNNRRYTESAMRNALPMFEGVKAYLDHPTKEDERNGRRSIKDLAGRFTGPRFEDGKVRATFEGLPNANGKLYMGIAEKMPDIAGNSHNAFGKFRRENGGTIVVEELTKVVSVDLVTEPATTNGLFENKNVNKEPEMEWSDIVLEDLKIKRKDVCDALVAEGAASRETEVADLKKELKEATAKVDEAEAKEALQVKKEKVGEMLTESKLPKEVITETFKESLQTAESDEQMKALIDDRIELVKKTTGGIRNMGEGAGDGTGESGKFDFHG